MPLIKKTTPILFVSVYFIVLLIVAATTPIAPSEAKQFYQDDFSFTTLLMHCGQSVFAGEIGFRLPFILLGLLNSFLFYDISKNIFGKDNDAYLALAIYLLLPGVIASTILSSVAVIMSSLLLIFLFLYAKQYIRLSILPLFFLMFIHWSASFVYLVLIIYAIIIRNKYLLLGNLLLLIIYFFVGIPIPEESTKSYFFELLSIYATIFSPFLFIYLFYALYRSLFRGERDIVWYITFLSFVMSLLFSLAERVRIVDFSPYVMLGIIVAVRTYQHSLSVRLRQFQKGYKAAFSFVIFTLIVNVLFLLLHQPIYRLVGKENYPLVAPVYEPYDLSQNLHKKGLNCIDSIKVRAADQMRYYGIKICS